MSNIITFNTTINYNTPALIKMNTVVQKVQQDKSMTSREIAKLVEKRHDNVKRTIETLVGQGAIRLPQFEKTSFIDKIGKRQRTTEYLFKGEQGKRDSIVVIAQLSSKFTGKLVDRWMELERQIASPDNLMKNPSYVQALLGAQGDVINQQGAIIDEHLTHMTVDEWRSLAHKYLIHSDKVRLGQRTSKLCREGGIPIGKQTRLITNKEGEKSEVIDNVYPKEILDKAADQIGLGA